MDLPRIMLSKALSNLMLLEGWIRWSSERNHVVLPNKKVVFFNSKYQNQVYGYIDTVWKRNAYGDVIDGRVIIDAGSNIGVYTLKHCDRAEKVIAFEPEPEIFSYLEKNLAFNGVSNVTPVNVALSSKSGEVDFYITSQFFGKNVGHEINPASTHKPIGAIKIRAITLDEIMKSKFAEIDEIETVKIDIEGHEIPMLRGSIALLERAAIKNFSIAAYHYKDEERECREFLENYGFFTRTRFISNGDIILYAKLRR